MDILISDVLKRWKLRYSKGAELSTLSSMRVGGISDYVVYPTTRDELVRLIRLCNLLGIKYAVIGGGTNTLFLCDRFSGVIISTRYVRAIGYEGDVFFAECGVMLSAFLRYAMGEGYGGAEGLFHIPGTVGGAIRGNAGAFGFEIGQHLLEAEVYVPDLDKIVIYDNKKLDFGYRSSSVKGTDAIILSAKFRLNERSYEEMLADKERYLKIRRDTQPVGERSLGSIFKRVGGISAGYYIDRAGLKGASVGGASVSDKHAGFIITGMDAKPRDVDSLINYVEDRVYSVFGVVLEKEIQIIV